MVLGHEVVRLDPTQELDFANGARAGYDALVSSIPLPEFVMLVHGAPPDVLEAAERLACSSCVLVNVGVGRDDLSNTHIRYFYDLDVIFPRMSYPHRCRRATRRPATAASRPRSTSRSNIGRSRATPRRTSSRAPRPGARRAARGRRILLKDAVFIPYANIIFDHPRAEALATVHGYLEDIGIRTCGRYGEWAYLWTDDSFKSGEAAAERALGGC